MKGRPISLRTQLFLTLVVATSVVWTLAAIWATSSTRTEVERVLDVRLREAANMVASLVDHERTEIASAASIIDPHLLSAPSYERQLSCQIWSLSGTLVGRSANAPSARLSDAGEGFSERDVDGASWRVYTVRNEAAGVEVLVGDNIAVRDHIARDLLVGFTVPMLLTLPLLAGMLWLAVGRGLAPLSRLAHRLEGHVDIVAVADGQG